MTAAVKHAISMALMVILVLCVMVAVTISKADAAGMCGKRADLLKRITGKYEETNKAHGIVSEVNLMEIFAGKPGGTWTIIVSTPEGKSCLIAAGTDWQSIPPEILGDDT